MFGYSGHHHRKISPEKLLRWTNSIFSGIFTQLSLLLIPHFFPSFSLLIHLVLSAAVLFTAIVLGQFLRRLLKVRASAPAFVLFHVVFVWTVYFTVVRHVVLLVVNVVFNGSLVALLIGFSRMLASDPGFVCDDSPNLVEVSISEHGDDLEELSLSETGTCLQSSIEETSFSSRRVRYCSSCKAYVMGFDHHCPAFGNCIGEKNYALFLVLIIGFIWTEVLYAVLSYQFSGMKNYMTAKWSSAEIAHSLAASTMLFSLLQVLWQVLFLGWHVYCVCFNIRTDEWINWRRYQDFHVIIQPRSDESLSEMRFRNPYHKGVLCNLKHFFAGAILKVTGSLSYLMEPAH